MLPHKPQPRRLGVDFGALAPADRHVDGVVDMVLDATQNYAQPLTSALPAETAAFLQWFNAAPAGDALIRATPRVVAGKPRQRE